VERVVVGVDGSEGAAWALIWAVREGARHAAPVTAVLAWTYLDQRFAAGEERFEPDYDERDARAALDAYVLRAVGPEEAATVDRRTVCDLAAPALLESATADSLLVVGTRGRGGFRGMLLGSVSQHCLHHSRSPIALVHPPERRDERATESGRIVVGVDGSETARRALRWAIDEGRVRQATVEVVHAWHLPYAGGHPFAAAGLEPDMLQQAARRLLDLSVGDEDTSGMARPPLRTLVEGGPAAALLEAARGADLVVVGSRGLGGFSGLLLGSVSHHVAHHARCPVVVVPPVN
jgi:nucleotide-binding universal stress UspA family protein